MPTGKSALKQLVLDQIGQVELYGDRISMFCSWDEVSTELLQLCLERDLITDEEMTVALHDCLLRLGRLGYDQHLKTGTEPDHITSPHALAYAIAHNIFSARALAKITFDHGDTVETFMAGWAERLPGHVLEQLKTWEPPEPSRSSGSPCC